MKNIDKRTKKRILNEGSLAVPILELWAFVNLFYYGEKPQNSPMLEGTPKECLYQGSRQKKIHSQRTCPLWPLAPPPRSFSDICMSKKLSFYLRVHELVLSPHIMNSIWIGGKLKLNVLLFRPFHIPIFPVVRLN